MDFLSKNKILVLVTSSTLEFINHLRKEQEKQEFLSVNESERGGATLNETD